MTTVDLWLPLRGRSMWPLGAPLEAGVAHTPWQDLRRGDVVAFVGPRLGTALFHRVHAIASDSVQTRGDTCPRPDPPLPHAALLGRVVAFRAGPVVFPVAVHGPAASAWRQVGLAWSQIAPHLRRPWSMWRKY